MSTFFFEGLILPLKISAHSIALVSFGQPNHEDIYQQADINPDGAVEDDLIARWKLREQGLPRSFLA